MQILEKTTDFNSSSVSSEAISKMPHNDKHRYMERIYENEENLQALRQLEDLIELRNQNSYKKKANDKNDFTADRYRPSDAEGNLKSILNEIKDQQKINN